MGAGDGIRSSSRITLAVRYWFATLPSWSQMGRPVGVTATVSSSSPVVFRVGPDAHTPPMLDSSCVPSSVLCAFASYSQ
jgi:hypothetical protein